MNKLYTVILSLLILLPAMADAKSRTITGSVVDEVDAPLYGATIIVKENNSIGTITDGKGVFSLNVPEGEVTLEVSYIGMESQDVVVAAITNKVKIALVASKNSIDQVVVTGYNQTTYNKMTGSVGVMTSDKIKELPQTSVDAILQGQVAGVSVAALDGQPGRAQKISIRGASTISGFDEPLWVVDGVPLQNNTPGIPSSAELSSGSFDNLFMTGVAGINPNDIENITILKDASSAAIYGSRASSGVIVVTTKKGKEGAVKVSYSANATVTMSPQRGNNLMNASQKIDFEQEIWDEFSAEKFANNETFPIIGIVGMVRSGKKDYADMSVAEQDAYLENLKGNSTDWYQQLFRNAISQSHHISLNGGTEKFSYYSSLGYTQDSGLLKNNDSDRYNFTSNFTITPNKIVKLNAGISMSYMNSSSPYRGAVDPFSYAYFANPYELPFNADGSYRADETYYALEDYNDEEAAYYPVVPDCGFNILRELNETESANKRVESTLRVGADISITDNLKFVSLGSYSYATNKTKDILGEETLSAFRSRMSVDSRSSRQYGIISQTSADMDSYMLRGHFSFSSDFDNSDHKLSVIAGSELRGSKSQGLYSKRYGYDPITQNSVTPIPPYSDEIGYEDLKEYLDVLDGAVGQTIDEQRYASFYASADYYYKDRYIFNFSCRTDGSSNFGSDQQFNPNGAAGFAWNASEEDFMYLAKDVLNRLTLKVSAGYTGNINRSVYPQMVVSYWDDYRQLNDNIYHIGNVVSAPNPNLRWERTFDFKSALDFGLFENRISGIFEGYYRKSTDVVTNSSVLSTTGYTTQKYNMADIENRGVEVTLNGTPIATKDFTLSLSANFAYNLNKITKYKPAYTSMALGDMWEGYPVDAIFSGKVTGIDPETGLYTFKLRPDAEINAATDLNKADNYRFYLGTRQSPYSGGMSLNASYKNLRLSVNGVYSIGSKTFEYIKPTASYTSASGDVVESTQTFQNDVFGMHLNVPLTVNDRWTESNTDASYPRLWNVYGERYNFGYYNPTDPEITRGAFLTDLSYARIKSIILGYDIPKKALSAIDVSKLNLSLSFNNFFTLTSYKGVDPETPGATYPISRSVTFALSVEF